MKLPCIIFAGWNPILFLILFFTFLPIIFYSYYIFLNIIQYFNNNEFIDFFIYPAVCIDQDSFRCIILESVIVWNPPTSIATSNPVTLCSLTSWIRGLSPGATALLITVRALAWVTERTVAAAIHGRPNRALVPPRVTMSNRSRWKPEPLSSIRSFLLTISLEGERSSLILPWFYVYHKSGRKILYMYRSYVTVIQLPAFLN